MFLRKLFFLILVCFMVISCSNDATPPMFKSKPKALGKMNQIVVVCDKDVWEGPIGDSLDYYLAGAYPIMPRPEEIFDLRHFTYDEITAEPVRKELRTYLIIGNTADTESPTSKLVKKDLGQARFEKSLLEKTANTSIGYNKWANGQMLIYLFAGSEEILMNNIKNALPIIEEKVNEHDKIQLNSYVYSKGENKGLSKKLAEEFNIDVKVPQEYRVAKEVKEEKMIWLRKETKDATLCAVFKSLDYKGPEQLSMENAKLFSNDFGKRYVSTDEIGSYMLLNDVDLPMLEYTKDINGHYTKEYRGIWEMENDFMGGPFADYFIVDEKAGKLLFVMTFIYAPGERKRDMMQGLDYFVKSINFNS